VDPPHAQLEAFLASLRRAWLHGANEIEMSALWHGSVLREVNGRRFSALFAP
jgi:hypothetical protein